MINPFTMIELQSINREMQQKQLINFPITTGSYLMFVNNIIDLALKRKSSIVCVANVHMFIEAYRDQKFLKIIKSADIVTPDGRPLVWGLQLLHGIKQDRASGMDLLPDLLHHIASQNISAYFYGGTQTMLNKTIFFLENKYPNLKIAGFYSPPFGLKCNLENKEVIDTINNSGPTVVFVILGCPKQEKWMASMKDNIHTVMIGIGGALPVMLGIQKRAPKWMQDDGLEWLFRLCQEPRRLFRRYTSSNSLFLWIFLKEYLKVKILNPLNLFKHIK